MSTALQFLLAGTGALLLAVLFLAWSAHRTRNPAAQTEGELDRTRLRVTGARHAQRLETVGQLAAGVAHDFNNLLAVVQAGTQLARESLPPGHPAHVELADVAAAAARGQALTRQLLAFSRKQADAPTRTDAAVVLRDMARFVPRILPRGVQARFVEEQGLGFVSIAPGALEQVILNLALNARDAMPGGGWIRVEARRVDVRPGDAGGLRAGPHVEIAVHDEGVGMTSEVRGRIFEPFFTTKGPGKGSGLGLATSLEIVEGAGGRIEVESEPGRGSVFRVLLPRLPVAPVAAAPEVDRSERPARRRTRILLAGQDPALIALVSRLLAARGHEVLTAASALEARQQAASFPGEVDVVVTGLVTGKDSGIAVLGEARRTSPRARAVIVSGDADTADVEHVLEAGVELVRRPVQAEALVEVVERAATRTPARRRTAMA